MATFLYKIYLSLIKEMEVYVLSDHE